MRLQAGKLRAGIIGLGVGEAHIRAYNTVPGSEVVALCDLDQEKLKTVGSRNPSIKQLTTSAEEILTDPEIDVVSIASYDNAHAEQILTGLAHNKHLFVEKPLCLRPEEAQQIKRALQSKPQLKLTSNLILRRSPRFIRLREMIQKGELGELFYLEGDYNYGRIHKLVDGWRGKLDYYSPVLGGGIHLIDLMLWLTGSEIIEVQATGNNIATKGSGYRYHDLVVAILHFANGMKAKLGVNFGCVTPHFHRLMIYGTKGTFENGADHGLLYTSRDSTPQKPPEKIFDPYPGMQKGDLVESFARSIIVNTNPEVTLDDIFRGLAVSFAVENASRGNGSATVKAIE